jgi:hypothetical protein
MDRIRTVASIFDVCLLRFRSSNPRSLRLWYNCTLNYLGLGTDVDVVDVKTWAQSYIGTTSIYNASVVNFYYATGSLARFES